MNDHPSIDEAPLDPCPAGDDVCTNLSAVKKLREEVKRLAALVRTDELTGLFNFRYFSQALSLEMERTRRSGQPTCLIMLDLDHFKSMNDKHGHEVGNIILTHVSRLIRKTIRRLDVPCRYGGEEFAVILPNTPAVGAMMVAEQLRTAIDLLAIPHALSDSANIVTMSIGVSTYYPNHSKASHIELLDAADRGLYRAKKKGRNRIELQPLPSITLQRQQSLG